MFFANLSIRLLAGYKLKYSGIMWGKRKKLRVIFQSVFFIGLLVVVLAGVGQLGIVREFFGQASFIPANLFVNTKAVLGPLPRPWRNLAQGGESHAWRIAPIADSVRALHPEYIRLDHIYDL